MKKAVPERTAFTLIELLIVVAIIAILAAIAVPNFLEAQMRAKVGRTRSDLRTIAMALESYCIDNNNKYPYLKGYKILGHSQWDRGGIAATPDLSTPVAYLSSVNMPDPFCRFKNSYAFGLEEPKMSSDIVNTTYHYINVQLNRQLAKLKDDGRPKYFLLSLGPDYIRGPSPYKSGWLMDDYCKSNADPAKTFDGCNYDPSNGTISGGDIVRHP